MPRKKRVLLERAAAAGSEAAAGAVLIEGGYPRDYAAEAAALMFGTSDGDVIESAAMHLRGWDYFTTQPGDVQVLTPGDPSLIVDEDE